MKFLVTGAAGFIGFHLTLALLGEGDEVIGVDNLNDYYDPRLKKQRLSVIGQHQFSHRFQFIKLDLADRMGMRNLFSEHHFDGVINLAAQAGVRYSLENPDAYVDSNLVGFLNILEGCRQANIRHLLYASSSSVYGANARQPSSTDDRVDHPISLYAATKKSNELMAHAYSHLFKIPTTGLRFFTVYGPYGRPDMAYYKFTDAILKGERIDVYNNGEMKRDFTYIDDIIDAVMRVKDLVPSISDDKTEESTAPYRVLNIGNSAPITLRRFIAAIEGATGRKAKENPLPMQPGDVPVTYADIDSLTQLCGFRPSTRIEDGMDKFVEWFRESELKSAAGEDWKLRD